MLAFMTRAAARDVESVLKSAIANAETNHGLSARELYVSAAFVGEGPTLKRWKARARGRVGRIHKRTCHITVRVAPIPGMVPPQAPVAGEPAQSRRARAVEPSAGRLDPGGRGEAEAGPAEEGRVGGGRGRSGSGGASRGGGCACGEAEACASEEGRDGGGRGRSGSGGASRGGGCRCGEAEAGPPQDEARIPRPRPAT